MTDFHTPVLEMLWEAHDPGRALADRFGFRDGTAAVRWLTDLLAEHWGVGTGSCERIVMSDGNALAWLTTSSGRLLAKWSVVPERFARLAEVARLTHWLDDRRVPVSAPIPALDGRLQVEAGRVSTGLQRVIDGELLDVTDPGQVRAAGVALAGLQKNLAAYPDQVAALAGTPLSLPERITGWLDSRPSPVPAPARDTLRTLVAGAPPDRMPRQLVHFDFRSANLLCTDGGISAILDFEEARYEHPLAELARAATLLGTRFRDWGPVPSAVRDEFLSGYRSVRPLSPAETTWLNILLLWQAMVMVPPGDDPTGWGPAALSLLGSPHR